MVLSDLKATYQYLNDHSETAREYLLLAGQDKMFLNVDDPANDSWGSQWCKADELILNLAYDHRSLKCVRKYLQPYEKLLLAAGSLDLDIESFKSVHSLPKTKQAAESTHLKRWNSLNEMRKSGELTDVILVPSDALDNSPELRAHRCVLASVVPHLRDALIGWKLGKNGEYDFYGSTFGATTTLSESDPCKSVHDADSFL